MPYHEWLANGSDINAAISSTPTTTAQNMVAISQELESLTYIDNEVTPQERSRVDDLIRQELQADEVPEGGLHPSVEQLLPLSSQRVPSPLLMQEIERYEEEEADDDDPHIMDAGIDVSRYSEFVDASGTTNYPRIYTTLAYSGLQERNLELLNNNHNDIALLQQHYLAQSEHLRDEYAGAVHQKRASVDEVNLDRKRRQVDDFRPVEDHLHRKWKEGISSVVELGVEAACIDMDKS